MIASPAALSMTTTVSRRATGPIPSSSSVVAIPGTSPKSGLNLSIRRSLAHSSVMPTSRSCVARLLPMIFSSAPVSRSIFTRTPSMVPHTLALVR
ncbi:hypothetical protein CSUI_008201 [Cystoisospora suis]|uniref:Uncharacterized protein n=1 Tax=Cystoisospora suis TaxID=483139 RepID=A0A2C6KNK4_9APIC|nr:hypothetical protein CSUI_008201 [Cystoisospora suis]